LAQASSLANLLLDNGAHEEALALLRRIEAGNPPARLELRAIAGLKSKEQRESEGRRVFQGGGRNDVARILFASPYDQAGAAPTLAAALEAGEGRGRRTSLWELLQADSQWAPLASFPEGKGILESQIRVLAPTTGRSRSTSRGPGCRPPPARGRTAGCLRRRAPASRRARSRPTRWPSCSPRRCGDSTPRRTQPPAKERTPSCAATRCSRRCASHSRPRRSPSSR
jgi:hypothetical protein